LKVQAFVGVDNYSPLFKGNTVPPFSMNEHVRYERHM